MRDIFKVLVFGGMAVACVAHGDLADLLTPGKDARQKEGKAARPPAAQRDSVITADRIEYDRKEGLILCDQNVVIDSEDFIMHSDRLLVFIQGTNDVQQVMAIGSVVITNQMRNASCDKAVFTKEERKIVMTGNPRLRDETSGGHEVTGDRITFWLDDDRMEVFPGRVILPPGTFNRDQLKKLSPDAGDDKKKKTDDNK